MPIRPENHHLLSEPLTDFLDPEESAAVDLMRRSFRVDVTRTYQFWEAAVARLTGGSLTAHGCPWDVELPYFDRPIRIEVKYSQESWCQFQQGRRAIFKFAAPKGAGVEKAADVIVLVGIDGNEDVYTWVIPARKVRKCASITLTSPRFRVGASRSREIDSYRCPPTQTLPEVLRAYRRHIRHDCHAHRCYSLQHHAQTRAETRRRAAEQAGQLTLTMTED